MSAILKSSQVLNHVVSALNVKSQLSVITSIVSALNILPNGNKVIQSYCCVEKKSDQCADQGDSNVSIPAGRHEPHLIHTQQL